MGSFDAEEAKATLNQYWYSKKSIQAMMSEVLHHATACAFLSTPSLFFALDERRGDEDEHEEKRLSTLRAHSKLLEYDTQWASDPAFVFYDFQKPDQVPIQYMGHFDYVVADPPFITPDVWAAYITTVKLLLHPGGKVLFTTVLENHAMLEGLMNGPLFIPLFRPLVRHLTYQYVCFLNYEPTVLSRIVNDEIEPEDPKVRAAIETANAIRQSEEAFARQMQERRRDGETQLPTAAYEKEQQQLHGKAHAAIGEDAGRNVYEVKDWETVRVEEMPWGHIPEGLKMYADGEGADPKEASVSVMTAETPAYTQAVELRKQLDTFKGTIDDLQKLLNQQLLAKNKCLKKKKEIAEHDGSSEAERHAALQAELEAAEAAAAAVAVLREEKLATMTAMIEAVAAGEGELARLLKEDAAGSEESHSPSLAYLEGMRECVEKYRSVVISKAALLELASSATGRYKAPVFNRMKSLLQEIKAIKKQQQQQMRERAPPSLIPSDPPCGTERERRTNNQTRNNNNKLEAGDVVKNMRFVLQKAGNWNAAPFSEEKPKPERKRPITKRKGCNPRICTSFAAFVSSLERSSLLTSPRCGGSPLASALPPSLRSIVVLYFRSELPFLSHSIIRCYVLFRLFAVNGSFLFFSFLFFSFEEANKRKKIAEHYTRDEDKSFAARCCIVSAVSFNPLLEKNKSKVKGCWRFTPKFPLFTRERPGTTGAAPPRPPSRPFTSCAASRMTAPTLGVSDRCDLRLCAPPASLPDVVAHLAVEWVAAPVEHLELRITAAPEGGSAGVAVSVRQEEGDTPRALAPEESVLLADGGEVRLESTSTAEKVGVMVLLALRYHPVVVSVAPGIDREEALRRSLREAGASVIPGALAPSTKLRSLTARHSAPLVFVHAADRVTATDRTTWVAIGKDYTLVRPVYVLDWHRALSARPAGPLRDLPLPSAYPAPIQLSAPPAEGFVMRYAFPEPPVALPSTAAAGAAPPTPSTRRHLFDGATFYMATEAAAQTPGLALGLEMCGAAAVLDPLMTDKARDVVEAHASGEEGVRHPDAVALYVVVDPAAASRLQLDAIQRGDFESLRSSSDDDVLPQEVVELLHGLRAAHSEEEEEEMTTAPPAVHQPWRLVSTDDVLLALLQNRLSGLPFPRAAPPLADDVESAAPLIMTSAAVRRDGAGAAAASPAAVDCATPSKAPHLFHSGLSPGCLRVQRGPVGTFMPRDTSRTPSGSQMRAHSRRRRLTAGDGPSPASAPSSCGPTPRRGTAPPSAMQTPQRTGSVDSGATNTTPRFSLVPEVARGSTSPSPGRRTPSRRRHLLAPSPAPGPRQPPEAEQPLAEGGAGSTAPPPAKTSYTYDLLRIRLYAFLVREGPKMDELLATYRRNNYLNVEAVDHAVECAALAEEYLDAIADLRYQEIQAGARPQSEVPAAAAAAAAASVRPGVSPRFKVPLRPKRIDALDVFFKDCSAFQNKTRYVAMQWDIGGRPPCPKGGPRRQRYPEDENSGWTTPQRRGTPHTATSASAAPSAASDAHHATSTSPIWWPCAVQAHRDWYQRSSFVELQQRKAPVPVQQQRRRAASAGVSSTAAPPPPPSRLPQAGRGRTSSTAPGGAAGQAPCRSASICANSSYYHVSMAEEADKADATLLFVSDRPRHRTLSSLKMSDDHHSSPFVGLSSRALYAPLLGGRSRETNAALRSTYMECSFSRASIPPFILIWWSWLWEKTFKQGGAGGSPSFLLTIAILLFLTIITAVKVLAALKTYLRTRRHLRAPEEATSTAAEADGSPPDDLLDDEEDFIECWGRRTVHYVMVVERFLRYAYYSITVGFLLLFSLSSALDKVPTVWHTPVPIVADLMLSHALLRFIQRSMQSFFLSLEDAVTNLRLNETDDDDVAPFPEVVSTTWEAAVQAAERWTVAETQRYTSMCERWLSEVKPQNDVASALSRTPQQPVTLLAVARLSIACSLAWDRVALESNLAALHQKWQPTAIRGFPPLEAQPPHLTAALNDIRVSRLTKPRVHVRMIWDLLDLQERHGRDPVVQLLLARQLQLQLQEQQQQYHRSLHPTILVERVYWEQKQLQHSHMLDAVTRKSMEGVLCSNIIGHRDDDDDTFLRSPATQHQPEEDLQQAIEDFCAATSGAALHASKFGKMLRRLNQSVEAVFPPDYAVPNVCPRIVCPTLPDEEVVLLLRFLHVRHLGPVYGVAADAMPSALDVWALAMRLQCTADPAATVTIPYRWHALRVQLADIGGLVPLISCNWCGATGSVYYHCVQGDMGQRNTVITAQNAPGFDLCFPCLLFYVKRSAARLLCGLGYGQESCEAFHTGPQTLVEVVESALELGADASGGAAVRLRVSLRPHSLEPVAFALDRRARLPRSYRYLQPLTAAELEWVYETALRCEAHGGATVLSRRRAGCDVGGAAADDDAPTCIICQEDMPAGTDIAALACGHRFHRDCMADWEEECNHKQVSCPVCRTQTTIGMEGRRTSAKNLLKALSSLRRQRGLMASLWRGLDGMEAIARQPSQAQPPPSVAAFDETERAINGLRAELVLCWQQLRASASRDRGDTGPVAGSDSAGPEGMAAEAEPAAADVALRGPELPSGAEAGGADPAKEAATPSPESAAAQDASEADSGAREEVFLSRLQALRRSMEELEAELQRLEDEQMAVLLRPLQDPADEPDVVELLVPVPPHCLRREGSVACAEVAVLSTWMRDGAAYNPTHYASCEVITVSAPCADELVAAGVMIVVQRKYYLFLRCCMVKGLRFPSYKTACGCVNKNTVDDHGHERCAVHRRRDVTIHSLDGCGPLVAAAPPSQYRPVLLPFPFSSLSLFSFAGGVDVFSTHLVAAATPLGRRLVSSVRAVFEGSSRQWCIAALVAAGSGMGLALVAAQGRIHIHSPLQRVVAWFRQSSADAAAASSASDTEVYLNSEVERLCSARGRTEEELQEDCQRLIATITRLARLRPENVTSDASGGRDAAPPAMPVPELRGRALRACLKELMLQLVVNTWALQERYVELRHQPLANKWKPTAIRGFPSEEEQQRCFDPMLHHLREHLRKRLQERMHSHFQAVCIGFGKHIFQRHFQRGRSSFTPARTRFQTNEPWSAAEVYQNSRTTQRRCFLCMMGRIRLLHLIRGNQTGQRCTDTTRRNAKSRWYRRHLEDFCAATSGAALHASKFGKMLRRLNQSVEAVFPPDYAVLDVSPRIVCPTLPDEEVVLLLRFLHVRHLGPVYGVAADAMPSALDVRALAMRLQCTADPAATVTIPYRWHALRVQLADIGGLVPLISCNWCGATGSVYYHCVQGDMGQRNTVITAQNAPGFDLCFPCLLFYVKRSAARLLCGLGYGQESCEAFHTGPQTLVEVVESALELGADASGGAAVRLRVSLRPHSLEPVAFALDRRAVPPPCAGGESGDAAEAGGGAACTAPCCSGSPRSYRYLQPLTAAELEWVYETALRCEAHGGATVLSRRRAGCDVGGAAADDDAPTCIICQEDMPAGTDIAALACGHRFHRDCMADWEEECNHKQVSCPVCRRRAVAARRHGHIRDLRRRVWDPEDLFRRRCSRLRALVEAYGAAAAEGEWRDGAAPRRGDGAEASLSYVEECMSRALDGVQTLRSNFTKVVEAIKSSSSISTSRSTSSESTEAENTASDQEMEVRGGGDGYVSPPAGSGTPMAQEGGQSLSFVIRAMESDSTENDNESDDDDDDDDGDDASGEATEGEMEEHPTSHTTPRSSSVASSSPSRESDLWGDSTTNFSNFLFSRMFFQLSSSSSTRTTHATPTTAAPTPTTVTDLGRFSIRSLSRSSLSDLLADSHDSTTVNTAEDTEPDPLSEAWRSGNSSADAPLWARTDPPAADTAPCHAGSAVQMFIDTSIAALQESKNNGATEPPLHSEAFAGRVKALQRSMEELEAELQRLEDEQMAVLLRPLQDPADEPDVVELLVPVPPHCLRREGSVACAEVAVLSTWMRDGAAYNPTHYASCEVITVSAPCADELVAAMPVRRRHTRREGVMIVVQRKYYLFLRCCMVKGLRFPSYKTACVCVNKNTVDDHGHERCAVHRRRDVTIHSLDGCGPLVAAAPPSQYRPVLLPFPFSSLSLFSFAGGVDVFSTHLAAAATPLGRRLVSSVRAILSCLRARLALWCPEYLQRCHVRMVARMAIIGISVALAAHLTRRRRWGRRRRGEGSVVRLSLEGPAPPEAGALEEEMTSTTGMVAAGVLRSRSESLVANVAALRQESIDAVERRFDMCQTQLDDTITGLEQRCGPSDRRAEAGGRLQAEQGPEPGLLLLRSSSSSSSSRERPAPTQEQLRGAARMQEVCRGLMEELLACSWVLQEKKTVRWLRALEEKWQPTPIRGFPPLEEQQQRLVAQFRDWKLQMFSHLARQMQLQWDLLQMRVDVLFFRHYRFARESPFDGSSFVASAGDDPHSTRLDPTALVRRHHEEQIKIFSMMVAQLGLFAVLCANATGDTSIARSAMDPPSDTVVATSTSIARKIEDFCAATSGAALHASKFGKMLRRLNQSVEAVFPPDYAVPNVCPRIVCPTLPDEEVVLLLRFLHVRHLGPVYGVAADAMPSALDVRVLAMRLQCTADPAATVTIPYRWHALRVQLADIGGLVPLISCNWCGATGSVYYHCVQGDMGQRNTVITAQNAPGFDLCFPCLLFYVKRSAARLLCGLGYGQESCEAFHTGPQTLVEVVESALELGADASGGAAVRLRVSLRPHSLEPVAFALDRRAVPPPCAGGESGDAAEAGGGAACTAPCCSGSPRSYRYLQPLTAAELEWVYETALRCEAHGGATVLSRRRAGCDVGGAAADDDAPTCIICQEDMPAGTDIAALACGHRFHRDCMADWEEECNHKQVSCPVCRTQTTIGMEGRRTSAKNLLKALSSLRRQRGLMASLWRGLDGMEAIARQPSQAQPPPSVAAFDETERAINGLRAELCGARGMAAEAEPAAADVALRGPELPLAQRLAAQIQPRRRRRPPESAAAQDASEADSGAREEVFLSRLQALRRSMEELEAELQRLEDEQMAVLLRPLQDPADEPDVVELLVPVPPHCLRREGSVACAEVAVLSTWMRDGAAYNPTHYASCEVITVSAPCADELVAAVEKMETDFLCVALCVQSVDAGVVMLAFQNLLLVTLLDDCCEDKNISVLLQCVGVDSSRLLLLLTGTQTHSLSSYIYIYIYIYSLILLLLFLTTPLSIACFCLEVSYHFFPSSTIDVGTTELRGIMTQCAVVTSVDPEKRKKNPEMMPSGETRALNPPPPALKFDSDAEPWSSSLCGSTLGKIPPSDASVSQPTEKWMGIQCPWKKPRDAAAATADGQSDPAANDSDALPHMSSQECFKVERMQCTKTVKILQKATSNDLDSIPTMLLSHLVHMTYQPSMWCSAGEMCEWVVAQLRDRMSTEQLFVVLKVYRIVHELLWSGSLLFAKALLNGRSGFFQYNFFMEMLSPCPAKEELHQMAQVGAQQTQHCAPEGSYQLPTATAAVGSTIPETSETAPRPKSSDLPPVCNGEHAQRGQDFVFNFLGYLESLCEFRMQHPDIQPSDIFPTPKKPASAGYPVEAPQMLQLPSDRLELYSLAMDTLELIKCTVAADLNLSAPAVRAPMIKELMQRRLEDLHAFVRLVHTVVCETLQVTVMDFLEVAGISSSSSSTGLSLTHVEGSSGAAHLPSSASTPASLSGGQRSPVVDGEGLPGVSATKGSLLALRRSGPRLGAATVGLSALSSSVALPNFQTISVGLFVDWYRLLYQLERTVRLLQGFYDMIRQQSALLCPTLVTIDAGAVQDLQVKVKELTAQPPSQTPLKDSCRFRWKSCSSAQEEAPIQETYTMEQWRQLWAAQVNLVMSFAPDSYTTSLVELAKRLSTPDDTHSPLGVHLLHSSCVVTGLDSISAESEGVAAVVATAGSTIHPPSMDFIPSFAPDPVAMQKEQRSEPKSTHVQDAPQRENQKQSASHSGGLSEMLTPSKSSVADVHRSTVMIIRRDGSFQSILDTVLQPEEDTEAVDEALQQLLEKDDVVVVSNEPCSCNDSVHLADRFQVFHDMPLGSGTFGHVFRAWDSQHGRYLAAKEVPLKLYSRGAVPRPDGAESPLMGEALREFTVLTGLDHPHIVRVVAFMVKGKVGCIFMEWMPAGSLLDIGSLNETDNTERPHTAMAKAGGPQLPPLLVDFLDKVFVTDRKCRPTAEELLQHPFLQGTSSAPPVPVGVMADEPSPPHPSHARNGTYTHLYYPPPPKKADLPLSGEERILEAQEYNNNNNKPQTTPLPYSLPSPSYCARLRSYGAPTVRERTRKSNHRQTQIQNNNNNNNNNQQL
eukprot:gene11222-7794_t